MKELQIISDFELDRSIMHYERLTKHILDEMPRRADIVFFLDQSHDVGRLAINKPLPSNVHDRSCNHQYQPVNSSTEEVF